VIPGDVLEAMDILIAAGFRAYIVGGAVRDLLLGAEPHDYDVATDATPQQVIELFERAGWKAIPTGVEYGTVTVVHPETRRRIEVTTFRRELYLGGRGRKPVVSWARTLAEDVQRRDFTINALAIDRSGNIVDLVGGLEDLRRGVVRFVGDPEERIGEDPLRMLRAIRIAAKLGFGIDPASFEAIRRSAERILEVSWERVRDEILKAAETPRFARFVELLAESGLARYVLPELLEMMRVRHAAKGRHRGESVYEHTLDALRRLDEVGARPLLKIAALLHDVGKTLAGPGEHEHFYGHETAGARIAEEVLRRLRFSSAEIRYVVTIVRLHMLPINLLSQGIDCERIARKLIAKVGELAPDLLIHAYADAGDERFLQIAGRARELLRVLSTRPLIDGRTIVAAFPERKPGPWVGELKRKLFELQLETGIDDPLRLLEEALRRGAIDVETAERLAKTLRRTA